MNKQEQRIAIAEACGFSIYRIDRDEDGGIKFIWCKDYPDGWKGPDIRPWPPEFPTDLNAMHEAEKVLGQSQQLNYQIKLGGHPADNDYWLGYHSTAAQRAEAFLKTLNLWTK